MKVGFRERSGADVAAQVLSHPTTPDALVCANDELALSTMKALQHYGTHIPDDIAVIRINATGLTPASFGLVGEAYRGVYPSLAGSPQALALPAGATRRNRTQRLACSSATSITPSP